MSWVGGCGLEQAAGGVGLYGNVAAEQQAPGTTATTQMIGNLAVLALWDPLSSHSPELPPCEVCLAPARNQRTDLSLVIESDQCVQFAHSNFGSPQTGNYFGDDLQDRFCPLSPCPQSTSGKARGNNRYVATLFCALAFRSYISLSRLLWVTDIAVVTAQNRQNEVP